MNEIEVEAIAAALPEPYTVNQVREVIDAWDQMQNEPPIGMVLRDPTSGAVAVRVAEYGQVYWRVVDLHDKSWIETEPVTGWDVLFKGSSGEGSGEAAPKKRAAARPATTTRKAKA